MPDLRPLAFADLDDTLFQTRRKMASTSGATQAATAANGDPAKASFMAPAQAAMFQWLNATTDLIPVTARSAEAFSRVHLPFSSWAVVSNGALILEPGGRRHDPWHRDMAARLNPLQPMMPDILAQGREAARSIGLDIRSWLVEEQDLVTYVVFKLNDRSAGANAALEVLNLGLPLDGWTRHFNAETLALIPPGSGKAPAVTYLMSQLNGDSDRPCLGIGDSLSDLEFMRMADVMLIPPQSQIAQVL